MEEKKLMDGALDELADAKKYIKCAMKHREVRGAWSKKYYEMAQDEVRHSENLYNMAIGMDEEHTEMERAYLEDQKDEYAECAAHVRTMLEMYRVG